MGMLASMYMDNETACTCTWTTQQHLDNETVCTCTPQPQAQPDAQPDEEQGAAGEEPQQCEAADETVLNNQQQDNNSQPEQSLQGDDPNDEIPTQTETSAVQSEQDV